MSAAQPPVEPWPRGSGYADPLNDLPPFKGMPRGWIIACSQRCGSTLLSDLLARTGRLGMPAEYLNFEWVGKQMVERLTPPGKQLGFGGYLRGLYRCRTSPEGFFGLKLQWHQYLPRRNSKEMMQLMRTARFIRLTRRDVIAQAVSGTIAMATQQWFERKHRTRELKETEFKRSAIDSTLRWILWENWAWDRFFTTNRIEPLHVVYEDLIADTDTVCRRICTYIGLPNPPKFDLAQAGTTRGDSERKTEWQRKYGTVLRLPPPPGGRKRSA